MATFAYSGVQAGKRVNGEINASDPKAASLALRQKKIIVTGIKKGILDIHEYSRILIT